MLRIVSDLFQTALLFFYDCKIGQLISRGYELIDLVVLQHVSDRLVDAGEQALGVALCNCDAVGKSFAEFDVSNDEIGVGLGILHCDGAVEDNSVDLIVDELVDSIGNDLEGDEVCTRHIVFDDVFLGGSGLSGNRLAGERIKRGVLIGLVSLDEDHCGVVGVVGI